LAASAVQHQRTGLQRQRVGFLVSILARFYAGKFFGAFSLCQDGGDRDLATKFKPFSL
jgi:hypothetical protein